MRPTRAGVLVALGLVPAVLIAAVVVGTGLLVPAVPWTLPAALVIVAAGVLVAALSFRRRLQGAPGARPFDPLHAARMVVLAKACSHGGALLAGAYAGLAVGLLLRSTSDLRRLDALVSGLAALSALALLAVGLLLERICRLPPPEDEPPV